MAEKLWSALAAADLASLPALAYLFFFFFARRVGDWLPELLRYLQRGYFLIPAQMDVQGGDLCHHPAIP